MADIEHEHGAPIASQLRKAIEEAGITNEATLSRLNKILQQVVYSAYQTNFEEGEKAVPFTSKPD